MPISVDLIDEHIQEWELLGQELARHELSENSRFLRNAETGEFWWPLPWLIEMAKDPELAKFIEHFKPLDEKLLAPMNDKLKALADVFELPHYNGQAEPNPLPGSEAQKKVLREAPKARCPNCGDKMQPVEILAWKAQRRPGGAAETPPQEFSGKLCCNACGHECMIGS